ncbi:MAG: hypothetical protein ACOC3X_00255 [Nanoarchaeota archaeon]
MVKKKIDTNINILTKKHEDTGFIKKMVFEKTNLKKKDEMPTYKTPSKNNEEELSSEEE